MVKEICRRLVISFCEMHLSEIEEINTSHPEYEYDESIDVTPRRKTGCPFRIGFSKYDDSVDLSVGRWLEFNEMQPKERELLEVLEAVRAGLVWEEAWHFKAVLAKTRGEIHLPGRPWGYSRGGLLEPIAWIPMGVRHTRIEYRPWNEGA